jgi:hypothetical protein
VIAKLKSDHYLKAKNGKGIDSSSTDSQKKEKKEKRNQTRRGWQDKFTQRLEEYKKFFTEEKPQVPQNHTNKDLWCFYKEVTRRYSKMKGTINLNKRAVVPLTADEYRLLVDAGFPFVVTPSEKWEENFKLLEDYKEQNNHVNVSSSDVSVSRSLLNFVQMMRKCKNKAITLPDHITENHLQRLDDIGFEWTTNRWRETMAKLLGHYRKYGYFKPITRKRHGKENLCRVMRKCSRMYWKHKNKEKKWNQIKIDELEKMGFDFFTAFPLAGFIDNLPLLFPTLDSDASEENREAFIRKNDKKDQTGYNSNWDFFHSETNLEGRVWNPLMPLVSDAQGIWYKVRQPSV